MEWIVPTWSGVRSLPARVRETRKAPIRLGPPAPVRGQWLLGIALAFAVWALGSATGAIDPDKLSAPWTVTRTLADLVRAGDLQTNLLASLGRASSGLAIGLAAGLALAVAAGLTQIGDALFDGLVQVKRAVPSLALIPLAIIWFGIGEPMKIAVIALGVFVPIYVNTHAALRAIDRRYVELGESLGMSHGRFLRWIVLPGALPGFFTGLRLAVTGAWTALVVVETVNATSGIGYMMTQARIYGQTDVVIAGLLVYGALGLVSDFGVRALETRVLSWRQSLG